MLLTDAEIELLTGKKRASAQRKVLDALNLPYRQRPDGSLVVFTRDMTAAPAEAKKREPQLNLDAFRPRVQSPSGRRRSSG